MKTVLVLAPTPELAEGVRTALNAETYRVIHRATVEEAEPLLVHGLAQACIVDLETSGVHGLWLLEKLRHRAPHCPMVVYATGSFSEWEEEAYLQGAQYVLAKPLRPRVLNTVLERLTASRVASPLAVTSPAALSGGLRVVSEPPLPVPGVGAAQTLGILRDFSAVLTHSLNASEMLKQFLLLLREILSINRAAIFVRRPLAAIGAEAAGADAARLRSVCAVGIPANLLQHFELSFDSGIGAHLYRQGRILRRASDEAHGDLEVQKEFELLGTQVAVPLLDRETVLGVAVFDGRITGEPLLNAELQLIFHLLEQVGLALKNIWLHDQLASNNQMLTDILRELGSACVVVSREMAILHANKTARRLFLPPERRGAELDFTDLPQTLGAKVYQVLKTGSAVSNFRYEPEQMPGSIFVANVVPFQREKGGLPSSALLMVEDLTQSEQLKSLEIEASNLRLVRRISERMTNEIGNALVPLTVHQQVLEERLDSKNIDTEFLKMMDRDLNESVRRVARLNNQMRFLARDTLSTEEAFPLQVLLEEAYQEARKHLPVKVPDWRPELGDKLVTLKGDRTALRHAFSEIFLNALQANPTDPRISVRSVPSANGHNGSSLQIEVRDTGSGFTPESAQRAATPFFTTRVVGMGLGLAVSRKIIEAHGGRLEILPATPSQPSLVRVCLPFNVSSACVAA